jgi:hypothetical protein
MYIKDIYESVNAISPSPQPRFLGYLDLTVRSLIAKYGIRRVINDDAYTKPIDINGDIAVKDEYLNAVISNILFLLSGNDNYRADYVYEADNAYKTVWREQAKNKKIVGEDWYHV